MVTKLVKIGNSQGVVLPKKVLKSFGSIDQVDIIEENNTIVLVPVRKKLREGWAEAFRALHEAGEDQIVMDFPNEADETEWTW
jgi:antitoxin MazE